MKVLVVEDETRIASFMSKGLGWRGYAVQCVGTGREALEATANGGVGLVVLDLGLPDMDGTDVLRTLRSNGDQVPVIIVTARTEEGDRSEGLRFGANEYLTKPFSFDELLARVQAHLGDPREGSRDMGSEGGDSSGEARS
jgi:DNA-binding response OmpR family regulator